MHNVSSSTGSFGYGETSWETGDSSETSERKIYYKKLIAKANSVPIVTVFKHYGIKVDSVNFYAICPFKTHKGGKENTPSFRYYEATNSFYCFGCKIGGPNYHACEFVSHLEDCSKFKAAEKIISLFENDIDDNVELIGVQNISEQLDIMMDFSNSVREFRNKYLDKKSQDFIEKRCAIYDELHARRTLDNITLRSVVDHLKEHIKFYISNLDK